MAIENQTQQEQQQTIPGEVAPEVAEAAEAVEAGEDTSVSIEDTARAQGWKPKEEYEGDKSKWVSAETFVAKGELIERIESLGKKLKDSERAIGMLKEHHAKVKESEFKKAVEFLKAQKKEAYLNGDVDKIMELDDKIAEVKDTQKMQMEEDLLPAEPEIHPDFTAWKRANPWYDKNSEMATDADVIGATYKRNNPSKKPTEILEHVAKKIKQMYPDEFENPNRSRATAVEGSNQRIGTSRETITLSEEEKRVMNTFVRQGIMTKEEYIAEIKKVRGA